MGCLLPTAVCCSGSGGTSASTSTSGTARYWLSLDYSPTLALTFLLISAAAAQPGQGQPGQASGDLQSQWAEYYRQLGYAYYGGGQPGGVQQGGGQQSSPGAGGGGVGGGPGGPEPKVCVASMYTLLHA